MVPRPRRHLLTYHGVLAPNHRFRSAVVRRPRPTTTRADPAHARRRLSHHDLLLRVLGAEAGPSWTPYGTSCGGVSGPPVLSGIGVPAPGQNVALELSNGPPGAPVLVLGGAGTGTLPIDPWCDLQITPLVGPFAIGATLPSTGALRLTAPIPPATPFQLEAAFQALVSDPTAPGGLGVTAPTRLRIE